MITTGSQANNTEVYLNVIVIQTTSQINNHFKFTTKQFKLI